MRPKPPASFIRPIGLIASIFLATFAGFGPSVLANDTPGNNGTVKIHEGNTEKEPGEVRNEPHVCTFHLHFYFADPQQAGTWEIQEWAPTGTKGTVVLSGTYDTLGDGEDRQPPAPDIYTLPDGHYKLFWDGDTGKHDKMKVFWVDCPAPARTPTPVQTPTAGGSEQPIESASASPPASGSETPTGSEQPIAGSASPTGGDEGIGGTPPASPATGGVEGIVGTPQATPPATDAATTTPATDDGWRAVLLGLAAVTALAVVLVPSRMLAARSVRSENKRGRIR